MGGCSYDRKHCILDFVLAMDLLVPSFVPLLFVLGRDVGTVGAVGMVICGVQLIVMLSSIGVTEHALRKNFDKDGKRR